MSIDGRERTRRVFSGKGIGGAAFWMGNPKPETLSMYLEHFGARDHYELGSLLGNDFLWVNGDEISWRHPQGLPMWAIAGEGERKSLSQAGFFAERDDPRDTEAFPWPDPRYLDFAPMRSAVDRIHELGMGAFGGMWTPFFHIVADLFGMENYFVKMYTDPDLVLAVTRRVLDFYLEANRLFFEQSAGELDVFFFGNDFGTQLDLFMSPDFFRRFVLPGMKEVVDLAKSYGLKVALHSCGSIARVIPDLIDIGIDALHPLQAKAAGMSAERLAEEYKGKLVFIGGVDTQDLLPFKTPREVYDEVMRLKDIFGEGWVVSPSHEALLPNVSPQNLLAMRNAALGLEFLSRP